MASFGLLLCCIVFLLTIQLLLCDDDECSKIDSASNRILDEEILGELYLPSDGDTYISASKQWSYPSYGSKRIHPSIIIYPKLDNDIFITLKFAQLCDYKVVIRSGGYQYDGLSSCNSKIYRCIQIDMKYYNDMNIFINNATIQIKPGVKLNELNEYLDKNNYYLPGGDTPNIGIGGHILSGGHGYLSKSHGLMADYIISFDIILSDGNKLENITCSNDLYWAVLGGTPGSFGIITNYEFDLSKTNNNDCKKSIGFIYIFKWTKQLFIKFGDLFVDIHQDKINYINNDNIGTFMFTFSYNFEIEDYVIKISWIWTGCDYDDNNDDNNDDKYYLSKLFLNTANKLSIKPLISKEIENKISSLLIEMHQHFGNIAAMPYMLRSYGTTDNFDDEFIDLLIDRIELVLKKYGSYSESGMLLFFRFESYAKGAIYTNDPFMIKTSYPDRNEFIRFPILMFYNNKIHKESKRMTEKWLDDTMEILMLTKPYNYGQHQHRHIDETFGDINIKNVYQYYYHNKTVWKQLKQIKLKYDQNDLFHTTFTVPLPNDNDDDDDDVHKKDL